MKRTPVFIPTCEKAMTPSLCLKVRPTNKASTVWLVSILHPYSQRIVAKMKVSGDLNLAMSKGKSLLEETKKTVQVKYNPTYGIIDYKQEKEQKKEQQNNKQKKKKGKRVKK